MVNRESVFGLNLNFYIDLESDRCVFNVDRESIDDDTILFVISIGRKGGKEFDTGGLSVEIALSIVDIQGFWFPFCNEGDLLKLPWKYEKTVAANHSIPLIAFVNRAGFNRLTTGFLDQNVETNVLVELDEINAIIHIRFQKPIAGISRTCSNIVQHFYISRNSVNWFDAVRKYVHVHDKILKPKIVNPPKSAYDPVFCSWYAIHHDVNQDWVLKTAEKLSLLGFKNFIIDDGWFFDGHGKLGDYSYTGDWEMSLKKFPDFQGMVEELRKMGIRTILWISPFMVGKNSKARSNLSGLLFGDEFRGVRNLCPRVLDTHKHLVNVFVSLLEKYDFDGFKVDFLDYVSREPCEENHPHDFETMGKGIYTCLRSIYEALHSIKSDILLEFRQLYANVAAREFSTMFRSVDAPFDYDTNRWRVVMNRSFADSFPVHFDPAYWHPSESNKNVARHMISSIFSVPMLSVDMMRLPQDHINIIRHWIEFYNAHINTLAHGRFRPIIVDNRVVALSMTGNNEAIIGVFEGNGREIALDSAVGEIFLLNSSNYSFLTISDELFPRSVFNDFEVSCSIFDEDFQLMRQEEITLRNGFCHNLDVPVGGFVKLVWKDRN